MPVAGVFLPTFALVLCAAAITTVIFHRLRQPVILGYLLAGLVVGPHLFPWAVADHATTETLAEIGVILLLFTIGLEFSVRGLLRVGGSVAITAIIDVSLMAWLGIGVATLLGWTSREALFAGAMITASSTTIIAKTFEEHPVARKLRNQVMGVLVVEDLVAVLFLAGLGTITSAAPSNGPSLFVTMLRLMTLLFVWVTVGLVVVPRIIRRLVKSVRAETTVIASIGLCFAFALLARWLGYSVALGAFIAGSLIAESGRGEQVAELVRPVRDVFAAVFFVAVGMLIDPALIAQHWFAVVVLTVVVLVGKFFAVGLGAFLAGRGTQAAVRTGLSMAQIGEFSFIIVSLGVTTGAVRAFLFPVAVAVSAITTLLTPWLIASSDQVSSWVDRSLPKPLQTYVSLYGTWVEELRQASPRRTRGTLLRGLVRWLVLDAILTAVLVILAFLAYPWLAHALAPRVPGEVVALILGVLALAVATPFGGGLVRTARAIALVLARTALPGTGTVDRAAAPRRALVITLEIVILLITALPVLAITQPFMPPFRGALILAAILAVLAVAAWRSAQNLEGHIRAGAELLVDAVKSALPPEGATVEMAIPGADGLTLPGWTQEMAAVDRFTTATHMLPGIGAPTPFRLEPEHAAVGQSLAELELRGRTGATVLGLSRAGVGMPAPEKSERLEAGDTLVLVGTREAVGAAVAVLRGG
ncbi:MAG TPA: cation:proton antiporter [Gemmatimonadales bacterium]|jgi:CPA2 family monovalent cation:H+ antiporter-2